MTALDQLVRLHRWTLDEKRQKLAELERFRAKLLGNIQVLEAELLREQAAAELSQTASLSLPGFIQATGERRRKIENSIAEVDRSIEAAREEITQAFQEFKKYETAHGNHLRREAQKQSRREQAASDELGIELHRRQNPRSAHG